MAFIEFKNVRIAGISAGVPKNVVDNLMIESPSSDYDSAAFVETTGVRERRMSESLTTGDLCFEAAEKLIFDLGWDKDDIGALIFVSQTPDYIEPATSCILQDRLGLNKECYSIDISLGCSGWVYGVAEISSLLQSGSIKKGLLLCGDAKMRAIVASDPLFGFAGTATAFEYKTGVESIKCHYGTDGSGYDAIIIPDGGGRNPFTSNSYEEYSFEGKTLNRLQPRMKGMDVFSFGISTAPKSIKKLAERFNFDYLDYDYFVFHQANMKMNNMITKKLKLPLDKVPYCMKHFGNTSSASIPLTIVSELRGKFENKPTRFICCGFGIGLSWGTVAFETNNIIISELVEVEENKESRWI